MKCNIYSWKPSSFGRYTPGVYALWMTYRARQTAATLAVLVNVLAGSSARAEDLLQSSVVRIIVGYRQPDYFQPWDMEYQKTRYGSGFVVDGHRIMTNAHVISDPVFIQVLKVGDTKKYTAHVEYVAHDCEVALLKVEDETFFAGTRPVKFGKVPLQRDRVAAYGFPTGGEQLSITEGIASRVEVQGYTHSQRNVLAVQIDAAINPGNSGGPVFKGDELVGISFQSYASSQNIAYMVPVPIIERFYADIRDGRYDGYPEFGLRWQKLESPAMRASYHLSESQGGVLVNRIFFQSSSSGVLREGDVILSIAGTTVARDGTVEFRKNERVEFGWLLNQFQMGDKVDLTIQRDGKSLNVEESLVPLRKLVPLTRYETKPTWFEFAGLVFMPLTYNYMDRWSWNDMFPAFRILFLDGQITLARRQVVFLNQVLPDDVNVGYQEFAHELVGTVNGKAIGDMADLLSALSAPVDGYHVIEFTDMVDKGRRIVLDAKQVAASAGGILKRFGLPADRSDDLR